MKPIKAPYTPPAPLQHELTLRDVLNAVANKYGKIEAIRITQEWTRSRIDELRPHPQHQTTTQGESQ